jgi:hypothetical protein
MSALTNTGKRAYLKFLKESVLHFAFGAGTSQWGTQSIHTVAMPANGEIILPHQFVSSPIVTNLTVGANEIGTQGTPEDQLDYFVDYNGGIVHVAPGFAATGNSIKVQYNHGFQEENPDAIALLDEKIRKLCLVKSFAEVNPNGSILVDGVRYSETETPTRYLYLQVWLEPNDYSNGVIREMGIFLNPTTVPNLPGGQTAFSPAEIATPGDLILVANYPTITRNAATRSRFHLIIELPLF